MILHHRFHHEPHLIHWVVRRYGSINLFVFGVGAVVYGGLMALFPSRFTQPALTEVAFRLLPRLVWAFLFLASGLAALLTSRVWAAISVAVVLSAWGLCLLYAALFVTGAGVAGFVWPIAIACALHWSLRARGTGVTR